MTERDPPGSPGQGFLYPRLREAYEGVTCWTYASPTMGAAQRIPTHVLTALWEQGQPSDGRARRILYDPPRNRTNEHPTCTATYLCHCAME